jgi:hypothetical protein
LLKVNILSNNLAWQRQARGNDHKLSIFIGVDNILFTGFSGGSISQQ